MIQRPNLFLVPNVLIISKGTSCLWRCCTPYNVLFKFHYCCTGSYLQHLGSFVVACFTLGCGMWDLVPWLGMEPGSPALGVWSLSHWTTGEVPPCNVFLLSVFPSAMVWMFVSLSRFPDWNLLPPPIGDGMMKWGPWEVMRSRGWSPHWWDSCSFRITTWITLAPWFGSIKFSSVQLLSRVWLFGTPWIEAHQASLSITISRSSLRLTFIESVMSSH